MPMRGRALLFAAVALSLAAARAEEADLRNSFPPGSITTIEQAQRALHAARNQAGEIERRYKAQTDACQKVFRVNRCLSEARTARDAGAREVRRIEVEARATQRKHDAEARQSRRAAQAGRAPDAGGSAVETRSQRDAAPRTQHRAESAERPPRLPRPVAPELEPAAGRELSAEERAQNVRRWEEKQAAAKARAEQVAAERAVNEKRREERRKQRETAAAKLSERAAKSAPASSGAEPAPLPAKP